MIFTQRIERQLGSVVEARASGAEQQLVAGSLGQCFGSLDGGEHLLLVGFELAFEAAGR